MIIKAIIPAIAVGRRSWVEGGGDTPGLLPRLVFASLVGEVVRIKLEINNLNDLVCWAKKYKYLLLYCLISMLTPRSAN